MTADKILKKYEDDNEYHFHNVDRKWIIAAMEEYAALHQPPVMRVVIRYTLKVGGLAENVRMTGAVNDA